jgi:hypothetical protein
VLIDVITCGENTDGRLRRPLTQISDNYRLSDFFTTLIVHQRRRGPPPFNRTNGGRLSPSQKARDKNMARFIHIGGMNHESSSGQ